MKHRNLAFSLLLSAALAVSLLTGCGAASTAASSAVSQAASTVASSAVSQAASDAAVSAGFTVTYADGTTDTFELAAAEGETLADALLEANIISKEEHDAGFVTTVNGVTADYNADKAWWCLLDANGEMTAVGISDIVLADGDAYGFAYTVG